MLKTNGLIKRLGSLSAAMLLAFSIVPVAALAEETEAFSAFTAEDAKPKLAVAVEEEAGGGCRRLYDSR